jgi:hypothetical protein
MLQFKRIFLGPHCQNACRSCAGRGRGEPSPGDLDRAVRQADAENILFWGGEPLIRDDLSGLVGLARRYGARRIKVRTNGRALADPALLKSLIEAGIYFFEVKVCGPDAQLHDEVCGRRGAFEETTAGLTNVRAVNGLQGQELRPYLECVVPVVRENLPLLAPTLYALVPFDPDRVHFELADPELPLLKVVPFLRDALEQATFNRIWATTLGVPLCLMAGYEPHVREALPGAPSGRKLKPCKKCALREVCPGIEAALLTQQGERQVESQISPFSASRYLDSLRLLRQPLKETP